MSQENKDKPPVPRRDPDKPNVPDWAKEINPALEDGSESTGGPESAAPPSESKPDAPAPGKAESAKPEPPKPAAAAKKPAPPAAAATKPAGTAPGKPAPPAPKPASASKKPVPKPKPKIERREFLSWLSLGWLAFSVASAAGLTAMGRFFFPNVLFEPPSKFKVGFPQDFADGQVDLRFKQKYRVWVIRDGSEIYALHAKCTHLGCTPSWLAAENKFKCPCHGSGFYKSGINFEGPAPRPLERVKISLSEDGQILLDKGVIYQQEKGQWSDPSSFLIV